MTAKRIAAVLVAATALALPQAHADEREELETLRATTLGLIDALVEQGVLTRETADALVKKAKAAAARSTTAAAPPTRVGPDGKPVVRVPYVPETVKQEIREQIKQEVLAQARTERWAEPSTLPEWLDRISLYGDLRLRAQGNYYDPDNAPPAFFQAQGQEIDNTQDNKTQAFVRARLGLDARLTGTLGGGLRITTGNQTSPISTNQSIGNYNNKYSAALDLAFLRWQPYEWLTLWGGRFPSPWLSTDLVWNESLTFAGVAGTWKPYARETDSVRPFLTLGVLPLELGTGPQEEPKVLYAAQGGFEWDRDYRTRLKLGLAYYYFDRIEGVPNPAFSTVNDWTAPRFRQKGNTVFNIDADFDPTTVLWGLASKFQVVNLTGVLDLAHYDPVHVVLTGDYARNVGFDQQEILGRTGLTVPDSATAWSVSALVGMPALRAPRDWQAFVGYKSLDANAVVDAFNDADFHLGGTNAKGYFVGARYAVDRNFWFSLRYLAANEASGAPLAINVLQLDVNGRF